MIVSFFQNAISLEKNSFFPSQVYQTIGSENLFVFYFFFLYACLKKH